MICAGLSGLKILSVWRRSWTFSRGFNIAGLQPCIQVAAGKSEEPKPANAWKWWQEPELNRRHKDFQSSALPTELSCQTIVNIAFRELF